MKHLLLLVFLVPSFFNLAAQENRKGNEDKVPAYQNLFTGGSLNLSFFGNTFMVGGSPVIGYSLTNFLDLGLVVNYNYTRYRDYNGVLNDRLHQYIYGGGAFARVYPLRFIFLQAQVEHNSIQQRYQPAAGGNTQRITVAAPSTLLGGGYTSRRQGRRGNAFYYLSVMFDVAGDINSPYTDAYGRSIPIVRGGIQVPLFQGKSGR